MPKYLLQGSYTHQGLQGLLKEGGTSRRAAVAKAAESVGAKLETLYFVLGSDDFLVILDAPSVEVAAALALTTAASGAVTIRTTLLLTPEDADAITRLSPAYRPPGG